MSKKEKAKLLGKCDDAMCDICYLMKSQNPSVKFHIYDEGTFYSPQDSMVCDHCLNWIREIRKKHRDQIENPDKTDIYDGINFWHAPKKDNESAVDIRDSAGVQHIVVS